MERELTILLVEDDVTACKELRDYIDSIDDVRLTDITNSSTAALELVRSTLPDVVILDLELHHGCGNGLQFLQDLSRFQLAKRPYILITTNNSSTITYETARQLGADFIMAKYESDYSAQYVIEFLRMIRTAIFHSSGQTHPDAPAASEQDYSRRLTKLIQRNLNLVGISPKAVGYQYLTDAIMVTMQNPQRNLSSFLGHKYHKSDSSVERAMQNAINRAWRTSNLEDLLTHYTARISSERGVPTIMEFVHYYATLLDTEF